MIQVWEAFGGRDQMLNAPASLVRKVTLYIIARNEHEETLAKEQQERIDEAERKAQR